jgi:serine/threonine protein kinase
VKCEEVPSLELRPVAYIAGKKVDWGKSSRLTSRALSTFQRLAPDPHWRYKGGEAVPKPLVGELFRRSLAARADSHKGVFVFEQAWPVDFQFLQEVPLPVAQLCARAQNETTAKRRHDTAFCALDFFLRLLASLVIAETARRDPSRAGAMAGPTVADLLVKPCWSDWLTCIQLGSRTLQASGEQGFRFLFERMGERDERFAACRILSETLHYVAPKSRCRNLFELAQLVGTYRNRALKHGSSKEEKSEEIGRLILSAVTEMLAAGHAFVGRRLVYVEDVEQVGSRNWLIDHLDLRGTSPIRMRPLMLENVEMERIPARECVYAVNRLAMSRATKGEVLMYSTSCCVCLDPLLRYDPERQECFFAEGRGVSDSVPGSTRYVGYLDGLTFDDAGQHPSSFDGAAGLSESNQITSAPSLSDGDTRRLSIVARLAARGAPSRHGDFEIVGQVAAGKHTDVYRARQSGVGRYTALKQLRHGAAEDAEARLNQEVHLLGQVSHPNVIMVLTRGRDPPWFTMPFVEGPTLGEALDALRGFRPLGRSGDDFRTALDMAAAAAKVRAERLSRHAGLSSHQGEPAGHGVTTREEVAANRETYLACVMTLVAQLAAGAHALHRAGIIHGNIHPQNVLISADGNRPFLIDLSNAQLVGRSTFKASSLPSLESAPYASPEQLRPPFMVDPATDIYNLGVILWELLTLRPIFDITPETDSREAARRIQYDPPKSPRSYDLTIPTDLNDAVLTCLSKDPEKRRLSAAELSQILVECERTESRRWPPRRRRAFPFSIFAPWRFEPESGSPP